VTENNQKRFPDNQTPLQALVAARVLIEQPENWTRRVWGENGKHCMLAALSRSASTEAGVWETALDFLQDATGVQGTENGLTSWNDTHTHAEVLAAYDAAIAKATLTEPPPITDATPS